ncbi:MAG: AraC family transcriptional regulator [Terricaulis sp.]
MPEPTIAAGYPRGMLAFAEAKGADRAALLQQAELSEDALTHQDNRVPVARYVALIKAAQRLTGDPAIALRFGEAVRMQDISIVGLIAEACETTSDVGPALNRYAQLVMDDGEPGVLLRGVVKPEGVWIEGPHDLFRQNPLITEAEMARLTWNGRVMFAGREDFAKLRYPAEVHFMHADPGYADEYTRVFGCPVVFNSHWNAMLVDHAFAVLKQPPVNRYVFGVLSERADALLKELQASQTTRGQVETLLAATLHTGAASAETIADKLNVSRQTLYRNLKSEGVTFEQVLDELRHKLALSFLAEKKVSVNETAYLVGFSEPAAFSRAFKRWTGQSPSAVRG